MINESNIYFIFTIDKSNFDKKELNFSLNCRESQITNLIRYDEIEVTINKKKIKLVNILYNISFTRQKTNTGRQNIQIGVKLGKNYAWINSFIINIPMKEYIFIYDYSLEDLHKCHYMKYFKYLNISQKKMDLQQKFSFFLRKMYPEKWENKELLKEIVLETINGLK